MGIRSPNGRTDDINTVSAQFGLGIVRYDTGQDKNRLNCYEGTFLTRQEQLSADHVDAAQILNNIGSVFARNRE